MAQRGFSGIASLIDYEPNAWFDVAASILVILGGIEFQLSAMEWIAVIVVIGLVFVSMALNLAVEFIAEQPEIAKGPYSGIVVKLSAMAVLVSNIAAFIVGLIIFIPKIFWASN